MKLMMHRKSLFFVLAMLAMVTLVVVTAAWVTGHVDTQQASSFKPHAFIPWLSMKPSMYVPWLSMNPHVFIPWLSMKPSMYVPLF